MKVNEDRCLIAYFSRAGENYFAGEIVQLETGNTEIAAKLVQELTGSNIFRIEAVHKYPAKYAECTEMAGREKKSDARPELASRVDKMADYDVIILGYPNWCGSLPMPVCTFLTSYDLTKKTILPFCTHEGSRLGNSIQDIKKLCPQAVIADGLAIKGSRVKSSQAEIAVWLRENGIIK